MSEIENIKGRTGNGESLWIFALKRNRERRQKLEGEGSSRKSFERSLEMYSTEVCLEHITVIGASSSQDSSGHVLLSRLFCI